MGDDGVGDFDDSDVRWTEAEGWTGYVAKMFDKLMQRRVWVKGELLLWLSCEGSKRQGVGLFRLWYHDRKQREDRKQRRKEGEAENTM
jgi:hypothetical protein